MSYNNITPWYLIGNPFGPLPWDGKYYVWNDILEKRMGPYDSMEEAKAVLQSVREIAKVLNEDDPSLRG